MTSLNCIPSKPISIDWRVIFEQFIHNFILTVNIIIKIIILINVLPRKLFIPRNISSKDSLSVPLLPIYSFFRTNKYISTK